MPYTFHLVHRTHLEMFDMLYYNVYSAGAHQDPWMFSIYDQIGCANTLNSSYTVRNTGREKTRDEDGKSDRKKPKYDYGCAYHLQMDVLDGIAEMKNYFQNNPKRYPKVQYGDFEPGKRDFT
eukprot:UN00319